jgi:hypothetical protein
VDSIFQPNINDDDDIALPFQVSCHDVWYCPVGLEVFIIKLFRIIPFNDGGA